MEDISLRRILVYTNYMGGNKNHSEPSRAAWKVMEVSRRSWIIGEGNGTLWSLVEDQTFSPKARAEQCYKKELFIPLCMMYDVLVYKML
jgi:hypothetical protein